MWPKYRIFKRMQQEWTQLADSRDTFQNFATHSLNMSMQTPALFMSTMDRRDSVSLYSETWKVFRTYTNYSNFAYEHVKFLKKFFSYELERSLTDRFLFAAAHVLHITCVECTGLFLLHTYFILLAIWLDSCFELLNNLLTNLWILFSGSCKELIIFGTGAMNLLCL